MAIADKTKNNISFLSIFLTRLLFFLRKTISQAINSTTTVLIAVANVESTFAIPILANIEVKEANIAYKKQYINHLLESTVLSLLFFSIIRNMPTEIKKVDINLICK